MWKLPPKAILPLSESSLSIIQVSDVLPKLQSSKMCCATSLRGPFVMSALQSFWKGENMIWIISCPFCDKSTLKWRPFGRKTREKQPWTWCGGRRINQNRLQHKSQCCAFNSIWCSSPDNVTERSIFISVCSCTIFIKSIFVFFPIFPQNPSRARRRRRKFSIWNNHKFQYVFAIKFRLLDWASGCHGWAFAKHILQLVVMEALNYINVRSFHGIASFESFR